MGKNILMLVKSHFKPELEALGHTVKALAFEGEFDLSRPDAWSISGCDGVFKDLSSISEILEAVKPFTPDVLIYHDDSNLYLRVSDLHNSPVPTIFYSVDVHIHAAWHSYITGLFDHTFVAQKNYIQKFWGNTPRVSWLPLWAPEEIAPQPNKDIPVCFRGNLQLPQRQRRVDFLRQVAAAIPLDYAEGSFRDAFPRSCIVLNEQIQDDINFRVFESIMCGACLVTPHSTNGLTDLFNLGEHLVTYAPHDPIDAISKLKKLLAEPSLCEKIAKAGRHHLFDNHLAKHRAQVVHDVVQTLENTRAVHAHQIALYNLVRWWGVVSGELNSAPQEVVDIFLDALNEIGSQNVLPTVETIFIACEFAAAKWTDSNCRRLCHAIELLSGKEGPHTPILQVAKLFAAELLCVDSPAITPEANHLFRELLRSSPLRVFDRKSVSDHI